jgi:hypothetical protein
MLYRVTMFASFTILAIIATPSERALADVDSGRIAYQSHIELLTCGNNPNCTATFPNVPAGHRLVVQHVSGQANFANTPPQNFVEVDVGNPNVESSGTHAKAAFFGPLIGINVTIFNEPVLVYFDAGATPTVSIHTGVTINDFAVTLAGYLLDCTASQCTPIAH